MNILFFIGNGFDLNLGIKTRYLDFYNSYKTIISNSEPVKKLKESMSNEPLNWSDLELEFGKYTGKIGSQEEFDMIFVDLVNNLGDYLDQQEALFDLEKINKEKFFHYLCFPETVLTQGERNNISDYRNRWSGHEWYINLVTFNYTKIIDRLIGADPSGSYLGSHHNGVKITLRRFEHIHGYTDDRMILGVNDVSQIKNQKFHGNVDIYEALIKSDCNKAHNHTIDNWCEQQIKSADLICIYGSSIGDTDNIWWKLIGEQVFKGAQLIIFTLGEEISNRVGWLKNRTARKMKNYFLSKTELTEEEKQQAIKNIYVGVNTNIFSDMII